MIDLKDIIICEECGSEFKFVSESYHYDCKVEMIKEGKLND